MYQTGFKTSHQTGTQTVWFAIQMIPLLPSRHTAYICLVRHMLNYKLLIFTRT